MRAVDHGGGRRAHASVPAPIEAATGPVRVLYVAGLGRSGSTLLASLLGEVPGLASAGEVLYLLERGVGDGDLCGCGRPVPACPLWLDVLARAGTPTDPEMLIAMAAEAQAVIRLRHAPRLLVDRRRDHPWLRARAGRWLDHLARTYPAIAAASGAEVVVDASKSPSYGAALEATGAVDLRVVHLVRDPRGVAASWSTPTARHDRAAVTAMDRRDPVSATLLWGAWNDMAHRLWAGDPERYLVVRYEDLVADPETVVRRVLRLAGVPADGPLPFLRGDTATLTHSHTVAGNPARLTVGPVALRADEAWRSRLGARDRRVVELLSAPVARRFGYGRDR